MLSKPFAINSRENYQEQKLKNTNSLIIKALAVKPVAFNPELGRLVKSATAGLLMSQLLFWWNKGYEKNCIYKTIKEIEEETCLTRSEQNTAIKKWSKAGVLKVKRKGIPQKRHFFIDQEMLMRLLMERAKEKNIGGYRTTKNSKQECTTMQLNLQDLEN